MDSHFEADELYLKLRETSGRRISRATVYRTLPLLEESGLIRRVIFIDKHTHYEQVYDHLHHEHLICLKCGRIREFYKRSLEDSLEDIAREHSFKSVAHKLEVTVTAIPAAGINVNPRSNMPWKKRRETNTWKPYGTLLKTMNQTQTVLGVTAARPLMRGSWRICRRTGIKPCGGITFR